MVRVGTAAVCCVLAVVSVASAQQQQADQPRQNAVLEGVQLSSEPTQIAGEKAVTCYFIFRDKPTSYFYEIKAKDKKLMFEFHDVQKGSSPIQSLSEPPIKGFVVDEKRVDVNAEVRGLNPEWHDVLKVTMDLDAIPVITVNEEYSVISFTYKWSTDPSKLKNYAAKQGNHWWLYGSLIGVGVVGAGVAIAAVVAGGGSSGSTKQGDLSTADLPIHTSSP